MSTHLCIDCGAPDSRFGFGGAFPLCRQCCARRNDAHKADSRGRAAENRRRGIEYWRGRGIEVGETVYAIGVTAIFGGRFLVPGTAKVGVHGAYVYSEKMRRIVCASKAQFDPRENWHRADEVGVGPDISPNFLPVSP